MSNIEYDGYLDEYKQIHVSMYEENRDKLINQMHSMGYINGVILMQGGKDLKIYDTDVESLFRQESSFSYLFAINEPGCYGTINLVTSESTLFIPKLDNSYSIWMGKIKSLEWYKVKYNVDITDYSNNITTFLKSKNVTKIYISKGTNNISGNKLVDTYFDDINDFEINDDVLYSAICECRVIKSQKELDVMKFVAKISSQAHMHVIKKAKQCKRENELEATFLYYINKYYGCRYISYTCICGSGPNSSILHYGHAGAPNNRKILSNDMLLLDMGAEYYGYDSDITCSFPVSGKFTDQQMEIYTAVLHTQKENEKYIHNYYNFLKHINMVVNCGSIYNSC